MTNTLYTVSRKDGDNRSENLTAAAAAEAICQIAWGCERSESARCDEEIIDLALDGEIRADCQLQSKYDEQIAELELEEAE